MKKFLSFRRNCFLVFLHLDVFLGSAVQREYFSVIHLSPGFMSFSGVWESYALTHTKVYFAFLFFDDEHFL
jgi:hypothetical protein